MSKTAYAKLRNVSRQTVYDWIAKSEVVMSGTKIDVEATERQLKGDDASWNGNATINHSPHRTLKMTQGDFWKAVQAGGGKTPPPTTDEEICQCLELAVDELGYSVEFLDDEGIYLNDGDVEYYFTRYDLKENAWLAMLMLRAGLCYTATLRPDVFGYWSPEGLRALSGWMRE